jgi:hypothetical protein
MKARNTCTGLERFIYLTEEELDAHESAMLSAHLATCGSCRDLRVNFLSNRRAVIASKTDIQAAPDFVESTVHRIQVSKISQRPGNSRQSFLKNAWSAASRISTAAAVFLMILFISEQTLSVHKISMLESRIQKVAVPASMSLIDKITLVRGSLSDQQLSEVAVSLKINTTVHGLRGTAPVRALLENYLRSGKPGETAILGWYRSSFSLNRYMKPFKTR